MENRLPKHSTELLKYIAQAIQSLYDKRESDSIARILVEELFGLSNVEIILNSPIHWRVGQWEQLNDIIREISQGMPMQYALGKAFFYGRQFEVNPAVLIPRQETELLVKQIVDDQKVKSAISLMDVGTGSGCIAISLALELPNSKVYAMDISVEALEIANKNAKKLFADVNFMQGNILKEMPLDEKLDVLVSNPPYVRQLEKSSMHRNVLDFEPDIALFVPDEDPLLFYRALAIYGNRALKNDGSLYVEINEALAFETCELLRSFNYTNLQIIKDLHGKDRFIKSMLS
ncbi:MAG: peptide chain release factor N(5)-glutamine methyltransferase [Cyclobacteriaceae bacterium]